ncbi:MAG: dephospho-CoA kinase [Candidatus Velthaea sp.]
MRVGLTGGIGSGKSAVAELFAGWGAAIVDADALAREAVAPGTAALAEIAARWPQTLREGSLDRAALSRVIFEDADARARVNAIVHPRVRARAAEIEAAAPADAIVVHVVPLLFEGDYWKRCDRTVLVTAPEQTRIARVIAREGWTPEAIEARMRAQIDPARAREMADYVIENDRDRAALEARARAVFDALRGTVSA